MADASPPRPELTTLAEWQTLTEHADALRRQRIRDLFESDPARFQRFSAEHDRLLLDYSKNLVTDATLEQLRALARRRDLEGWIEHLFSGEAVNTTENRAAMHMALRNRGNGAMYVGGRDVMPDVQRELTRMRLFVNRLHRGEYRGCTGRVITDVVNIGVGGSDLGAVMATEALAPYRTNTIRLHFVSSIDGVHVTDVLERVNPKTTLFIISSKSFTTLDTMTNARTARDWFRRQVTDPEAMRQHFLAVSANEQAMAEYGIAEENRFRIWDWVGGRYSLASAVGLPVAIAVGMKHFEAMLEGFHGMDRHFRTTPWERNLPVLMGLLGVWYTNFLDAAGHAVLPYDHRLNRFPAYLQQLEMESNGKCVTRDGAPVDYHTGAIVWGEAGPNAQHSFFQLLHQGTRPVMADFLAPVHGSAEYPDHHELALANCFAQTRALMEGQTAEQARREMEASGMAPEEIQQAVPHKVHPGNKPSNTLLFDRLDPATLGALVALYEHKVFVQSVIWGINPFDQWGVELGKKLAKELLPAVTGQQEATDADPSTRGLLSYIHRQQ
ncbi:glucose-6-phosphate isomerase [Aquisalimonas lutea]|uniref:glucose-6-phosphate isomerase n=1 Tax=Aquisalimonas lutea TaxID=1327750 RepID=UPI0025B3F2E8|nr:glucose-6-phosphate isomerase [Aquisalimonas lutea]MDN3517345.1 glucose-6-phosphate isomerase [Aquisalimonas lutea]